MVHTYIRCEWWEHGIQYMPYIRQMHVQYMDVYTCSTILLCDTCPASWHLLQLLSGYICTHTPDIDRHTHHSNRHVCTNTHTHTLLDMVISRTHLATRQLINSGKNVINVPAEKMEFPRKHNQHNELSIHVVQQLCTNAKLPEHTMLPWHSHYFSVPCGGSI